MIRPAMLWWLGTQFCLFGVLTGLTIVYNVSWAAALFGFVAGCFLVGSLWGYDQIQQSERLSKLVRPPRNPLREPQP